MKIKTAEATPPQLNWLVAKCVIPNDVRDNRPRFWLHSNNPQLVCRETYNHETNPKGYELCRYSVDPAQGQPILEEKGIAVRRHSSGTWYAMLSSDLGDGESARWAKVKPGARYGKLSYQVSRVQCRFEGLTMLIAGLRCFVASELGDEVDVPEELVVQQ